VDRQVMAVVTPACTAVLRVGRARRRYVVSSTVVLLDVVKTLARSIVMLLGHVFRQHHSKGRNGIVRDRKILNKVVNKPVTSDLLFVAFHPVEKE
jgi:hypothetical protein